MYYRKVEVSNPRNILKYNIGTLPFCVPKQNSGFFFSFCSFCFRIQYLHPFKYKYPVRTAYGLRMNVLFLLLPPPLLPLLLLLLLSSFLNPGIQNVTDRLIAIDTSTTASMTATASTGTVPSPATSDTGCNTTATRRITTSPIDESDDASHIIVRRRP